MPRFRWTTDRLNQLESAARRGLRVSLTRRGTEYVVVALRVGPEGRREVLVGRLPMTGEEMSFALEEIDSLQVIGD